MPSATTGRHQRDGSRPSGNSSNVNAIVSGKNSGSSTSPNQPAAAAPGSEPGNRTRPRKAYSRSENSSTSAPPPVSSTGPSRLPGRNATSSAPTNANASPARTDCSQNTTF